MVSRLIAIWKWLTPWLELAEPTLRWTDRIWQMVGVGSLIIGAIGAIVTAILSVLAQVPPYLWIPLAFAVFCLPPIGLAAIIHVRDRWRALKVKKIELGPKSAAPPATSSPTPQTAPKPVAPKQLQFDERLKTLFAINQEKRFLWLKYLPDAPQSKASDTIMALLFGYKEIFGVTEVRKTVLNWSVAESKYGESKPINDLMSIAVLFGKLQNKDADELFYNSPELVGNVKKHGLARGGVYSLTENGYGNAHAIVMDLIQRAH
jgi:hypothetical protein